MKKICQTCKQPYTKSIFVCQKQWDKSKYCSIRCRGIGTRGFEPPNKALVDKICRQCNGHFTVSPYRKDTAQFCSRRCLGLSRNGDKCARWQGGLTAKHTKIRNSDAYKLWRKAVFERDNYTCVYCGDAPGGRLEADHIKLFSLFPELRLDLDNGQTLCQPCHRAKTRDDRKLMTLTH